MVSILWWEDWLVCEKAWAETVRPRCGVCYRFPFHTVVSKRGKQWHRRPPPPTCLLVEVSGVNYSEVVEKEMTGRGRCWHQEETVLKDLKTVILMCALMTAERWRRWGHVFHSSILMWCHPHRRVSPGSDCGCRAAPVLHCHSARRRMLSDALARLLLRQSCRTRAIVGVKQASGHNVSFFWQVGQDIQSGGLGGVGEGSLSVCLSKYAPTVIIQTYGHL